ncbi:coiled-coil domain-containing protein 82 [Gastrophryne carolinensis]
MESDCKSYNTRRKRRLGESVPKSRVDWKRTKVDPVSHILDYDETSEEEEEEAEDHTSSSAEESEEQKEWGQSADEGEEERIKKPHRKSESATIASSDSSDSDGPGTRVRRCRAIDEDDEAKDKKVESSEDEKTKAQHKKKMRKETLKQLAARRHSRNQPLSSEPEDEGVSSDFSPPTPETPNEEEDSQEMADFIVEDDEEDEDGNQISFRDMFVKHDIAQFTYEDLQSHLQKVIRAFLINIADSMFLKTLYDGSRQKRYAKDMLKSLNYVDERVIGPRLEKLTSSCRWTNQYKVQPTFLLLQERVNSYPEITVRVIEAEKQSCEACHLQRYCKYLTVLSGGAYDSDTLEKDDFLTSDRQVMVIGTTCARRSEVYHSIKHYKYHLYQRCIPFLHEDTNASAKEKVERALLKMGKKDFINREFRYLESLVKEADYFEEELLIS